VYKHYKPAQEIFVDREEYLHWMDEALERCKEKSVILHLRGIGGIGKSTLLNHWTRAIDSTVRLDCQQYTEFYSRLDILAKGAVRVGVDLKRFDILWHIRKRFVEGVEPATEKGRDWAKEVLVAIPFIGSLASIGSAIKSVGESVAPKLRQRYGEVGQWLQDRLGAQYMERLLEILWKEPQHAEFLYLDALLEDINNRKNSETPLLFLFDHSENVDYEDKRWIYAGKKIAEMELWYVFVSSLKNCVGVIASRRAAPELTDKTLKIEERELVELDRNSSRALLLQRGVVDENLQDRIVSISAGNPFVINTICDMQEAEELSTEEIESLRAETLDDVRLKTWRRLFSHTKDLLGLVDRAGLLPSFHKELMTIVSPDMKTDQWERLIRLSFVKPRSNGSFILHDLARDLVRAELGDRMSGVATEVSNLLKEASERENNPALLGFALAVKALDSEEEAIAEMKTLARSYIFNGLLNDALTIVENLTFRTYRGDIEILGHRGMICAELKRFSEAEFSLKAAISSLEDYPDSESLSIKSSIGSFLVYLGDVLQDLLSFSEAEAAYSKAVETLRMVAKSESEGDLRELIMSLRSFAFFYYMSSSAPKGVSYAMEALEMARELGNPSELARSLNVAGILLGSTGQYDEQVELYQEAISIQRKTMADTSVTPVNRSLLAALLSNLSMSLRDQKEIERNYAEISEIREELAEIFPAGLAFSKMHYGWWCLKNHRFDEAEEFIKKALDFYIEQGEEDEKGWSQWIDISRLLLAIVYIFGDRLSLARSMIDLITPSDISNLSTKSEYGLLAAQLACSSSGFYHYMMNQTEKAVEDFERAVDILDRLVIDTSDEVAFAAQCLLHCGILYTTIGRYDDAKDMLDGADKIVISFGSSWSVEVYKAISDANLALIHYGESRFNDAQKRSKSAIEKMQQFTDGMPAMFLPQLGKMLNNYSAVLSSQGKQDDAMSAIQQAIAVKRKLVENDCKYFKESLAVSLNNSGILHSKMGNLPASKEMIQESLAIFRELSGIAPEKYALRMASSLHNLSLTANFEGDEPKSNEYYNEALNLRKRFLDSAPEIVAPLIKLKLTDAVKNEVWSEITEPLYLIF
jgi:tetratricopeptide (TPR) repeat protein